MVDLDAALGEQLLDVAIGQAEPNRKYQRTATTITSGGNRKPAKADRGRGAERGRRGLMATVSPLRRGHGERNRAF
jgi:hypothetical protein